MAHKGEVDPRSKKKPAVSKDGLVSKRNVEKLLKELGYDYRKCPHEREERRLRAELEILEKRLLAVPEYQALEKAMVEASDKGCEARARLDSRVIKIRRRYYAHGLTPAVIKEIQDLVEERNREEVPEEADE